MKDSPEEREVGVDAPVVRLVGVSQGGTRDFAAKPDVVELGLDRAQTDFDVAQAFAIGHAKAKARNYANLCGTDDEGFDCGEP